jgi:peptidyl-prolyl cis-trans isomerase A (cyclophilin A)
MTSTAAYLALATSAGNIVITVHTAAAPQTTQYVRELAEAGRFDGAAFYRSTNFGVDSRRPLIQGGPLAPLFTGSGAPIPAVDLLEAVESTGATGLAHVRGTVSLARDLFSTGHVLPELFGSVTTGLDVVASIAAMETNGASAVERLAGEMLTKPVSIYRATFETRPPESSI